MRLYFESSCLVAIVTKCQPSDSVSTKFIRETEVYQNFIGESNQASTQTIFLLLEEAL